MGKPPNAEEKRTCQKCSKCTEDSKRLNHAWLNDNQIDLMTLKQLSKAIIVCEKLHAQYV